MDSPVLGWALAHGYPLMFLGMAVEGPLVTAGGAFAASMGLFDIRIVMLLSLLGDVLPDCFYYSLGYWSRNLEWLMGRLRVPAERLTQLENFVSRHQIKALAVFKYVPLIAVTGLVLTGRTRMPFRKFFLADILLGIPNTLLFAGIGYFFGQGFVSIIAAIDDIRLAAAFAVAGAVGVYFLRSWIRRTLSSGLADRYLKDPDR